MTPETLKTIETKIALKSRYDNFIGGEFIAPVEGRYFENITPVTGGKLNEVARSGVQDVELALDAAHKAKDAWARTSATFF